MIFFLRKLCSLKLPLNFIMSVSGFLNKRHLTKGMPNIGLHLSVLKKVLGVFVFG